MMDDFTEWRDFDLSERVAKIKHAFKREPVSSAEEVPILINTPCYFAFGTLDKPEDYFTNPASMVDYQANGYEKHLANVNDDYVPYFMPWFGTGVLASAFGCEIRLPNEPGDDPAVAAPCITSPSDAAHIQMPDPYQDGWMPRVLDTIDYALANGDLPVGLTDMQGPLDTLGQMCGQAQLYEWMYKEPKMVHELFDLVTEAFIAWVKVQKKHIGEPLDSSNGLQGAYSPGAGVWESDDDLVLIDPGLYGEFVVPYLSRIFEAFGNGSVHFCGNGAPHIENLLSIKKMNVVNNSPLGDFDDFTKLWKSLSGRVTIQIQDATPVDVESYYPRLFAKVDDFRGIMLATFVIDNTGMDDQGGYIPVEWDPFHTANRIVSTIRETVSKRLKGEPTVAEEEAHPPMVTVVKPAAKKEKVRRELSPEQELALKEVKERLTEFDSEGLQRAVRAALDTDLAPFDIVVLGMAEGMGEVGRLYEEGEFFLPQLVMAGKTMQEGMTVLQPLLKGEAEKAAVSKGIVILGTVQGDLHDIGKNLVGVMLDGAGFKLVDLGVDVPPEKFVEAVETREANIVAMSALLTTTMPKMGETIKALEEAGLREKVKIMVGGAPVGREFANQISAEGYAKTAVGAVREANRLMEMKDI
jgi:5-methyltetrahydrofolate--homocysteine methyltransferase